MIRKMQNKVLWPALGIAVIGVTLTGCGGNNAGDTAPGATTAQAPAASPTASTETASTGAGAQHSDHNHDAQTQVTMAKFFPGAQLSAKPFPFNEAAAAHMGEEAGVKFSGKEGEWQVFEATQNGKRVGMAVMTHSTLPDGKDMHVAFAVNPKFAITHVTALNAPDAAKMKTFIAQTLGKNYKAAFKVGKDLKAAPGLSPQVAQVAADAVHKGVVILIENFDPAHAEEEGREHTEDAGHAGHKEGDGHSH